MTLKLTRRRNGKMMTTLRVEHHIDREGAVLGLAYHAYLRSWDEDDAFDDRRATHGEVVKALRDMVWNHGAGWEMHCSDNLPDLENAEQLTSWAEREIGRLYPGWGVQGKDS